MRDMSCMRGMAVITRLLVFVLLLAAAAPVKYLFWR